MRSDCKLSDAELAVKDLPRARQYATAALPFLDKFNVGSPSLLVLRDLGFCYESEGAIQHQIAMDRNLPSSFAQPRCFRELLVYLAISCKLKGGRPLEIYKIY